MLEYFTYKKVKKLNAEKRARKEAQKSGLEPVLSGEDERFIERIVADGTPPALPERPTTANQSMSDVDRSISPLGISTGKERNKENEKEPGKVRKKANRISLLFAKSKKDDIDAKDNEREDDDITRVLNDLNMSVVNNRALSLSKESNELIQKFTLVLKDLVNGVPTAYDDLTHLLDDSQGTLAKTYDHLPSFLKKLIATLPQKWTSTLAPELLATASEAHTLGGEGAAAAAGGGLMGAAKGFLKPNGLKDLVTKPGAVAALLRTIMNSLKVRFPAFMGTNVLLSLSLFVLLFVLWYCHKRGREVRLAAESKAEVVDSEGRVTKVKDDHLLEFSASPRDEPRRRSHDSGRLRELSSNSSPRRKSRDSRRHNSNSNNNHSPKRDSHNSHGIDDSIASSSPRRRHERSRSPGRRHHER